MLRFLRLLPTFLAAGSVGTGRLSPIQFHASVSLLQEELENGKGYTTGHKRQLAEGKAKTAEAGGEKRITEETENSSPGNAGQSSKVVSDLLSVPLPGGVFDVYTNFGSAFTNSLGMIFATEIGDKTFFIAAIMAMRNPRLIVFLGAIGALAVMTVLSTILGYALPQLLPKVFTHYCSIILFCYFGFKMLHDAKRMYDTGEGTGASEELEEVECELVEKGLAEKLPNGEASVVGKATFSELNSMADPEFGLDVDLEGGSPPVPEVTKPSSRNVIFQAFVLTFLAEWGDRSQIATIALAAAQNPYGVTLGAILGHSICTGGAVIGGKFLASRITERQVALSGGILFFVFAFYSWYVGM